MHALPSRWLLLFFFVLLAQLCYATPKQIRVVMDDNYPPYVFKTQSGQLQGITIDQWHLWEQKTGIAVKITATDWAMAQKRMRAGDFDVIDTIFRNPKRERTYLFTKPYANLPVPLFVQHDISGIRGIEDLDGFTIAVKNDGAVIDFLAQHGITNIQKFSSYENMVEAAKAGKMNIFTAERPPAIYFMNKGGILDQFRETKPMYTGQFHRAIAKNKPQLLSVVEEGFAQISPAEYQAIDKRWRGTPLMASPYIIYGKYLLLVVALILGVSSLWLWSLKRTVKQKIRALSSSEQRYRSLVENIPLGITLIDKDYKIKMVNRFHAQLFGHPAGWFVGRNCHQVFEKNEEVCSHCPGVTAMVTGAVSQVESEGITDSGKIIQVHIRAVPIMGENGAPNGFIEVVEDITENKRLEQEQKKLEQKLLHTQKLESLGVLAGGIAHDFNNLLAAIIGNAELGQRRMKPESPAVSNLQRIEQAAERAADLAKQMLAYSGKGKFVVETIDLNQLAEEMLHMLEVSISKKAVLRLDPHHPLPRVEADATQLRQIIMNLVINASEAIGETSGVIAITTGCMDCDDSYLKDIWLAENLSEGLYVYLEIADSGCGMNRETIDRLFDPFFTTKFTGRGLGMSAVLGIVRGHKGAIKVYSEPDKGTTFKILLPASNRPQALFNDTAETDDWQGSGKILLVDDEETVRGVGVEMLKELGFDAITAVDGVDALAKFQGEPDLGGVILDLTMPHMDGKQCFRELKRLDPQVKVILSSGYNEQEITQSFIGKGLTGFIQKPYTLSTLRTMLRRTLNQKPV